MISLAQLMKICTVPLGESKELFVVCCSAVRGFLRPADLFLGKSQVDHASCLPSGRNSARFRQQPYGCPTIQC